MPEQRYRLLIFDWDGTLLDSIGAIVGCTQATLEELGLPSVPAARIRAVIGLGLRETVDAICPGCDEATLRSVVEVYRRLWLGDYCRRPILFEGVSGLLDGLARRRHLLAVATAKSRLGLEHDLVRTGVGSCFVATRTVDEAPSKPNPRMLWDILEELGAGRDESLMIGDTVHDLEMAANAGIDAVGVTTGTVSRDELLATPARACLSSVTELPGWLNDSR